MVYLFSMIFTSIDDYGGTEAREYCFELVRKNSKNPSASVCAKYKLVSLIALYSEKVIRINGLNSLHISLH